MENAIEELIEANQYHKAAQTFLDKHNLIFKAMWKSAAPPDYHDKNHGHIHGHKYSIIIERATNGRRLTFDFWNSYSDACAGEAPKPYDVLTTMSSEIDTPGDFHDFCAEFGYDEDSRQAEKTFKACRKFADKLNAFFNEEERADLRFIR